MKNIFVLAVSFAAGWILCYIFLCNEPPHTGWYLDAEWVTAASDQELLRDETLRNENSTEAMRKVLIDRITQTVYDYDVHCAPFYCSFERTGDASQEWHEKRKKALREKSLNTGK